MIHHTKKLAKSFYYAAQGIEEGMKQRNLRVQSLIFIFTIILSVYYQIDYIELILILIASSTVLTAELINSSIEETCNCLRDCLGAKYHETKVSRDIAAGAVLMSSIFALIIGLIIFIPKIFY